MRVRVARVAAVVGTAGPPLYLALTLVLGTLEPGYDVVRDTQSELGAVDAERGEEIEREVQRERPVVVHVVEIPIGDRGGG